MLSEEALRLAKLTMKLPDYFSADVQGLWYKVVNFGAKTSPNQTMTVSPFYVGLRAICQLNTQERCSPRQTSRVERLKARGESLSIQVPVHFTYRDFRRGVAVGVVDDGVERLVQKLECHL